MLDAMKSHFKAAGGVKTDQQRAAQEQVWAVQAGAWVCWARGWMSGSCHIGWADMRCPSCFILEPQHKLHTRKTSTAF